MVQTLDQQSRENTKLLIENIDLIIATGGRGVVKVAYSSGKPALGVGAGNAQCILDWDIDIADAVPKIIKGRTLDNGIICLGEQIVIIADNMVDQVLSEFEKHKAYVVSGSERNKLRDALFIDEKMNKHVIGQSVEKSQSYPKYNCQRIPASS